MNTENYNPNKKFNFMYVLIGLLAVGLMVAVFYIGRLTAQLGQMGENTQNSATEEIVEDINLTPIREDDHIRGDVNAKFTLIEYSDYECPYCQSFHPTAQRFVDEYSDVNWVYRNFPLKSIHPNANNAAMAAECIAQSNGGEAFWTFTDAIYDNLSPKINASFTGLEREANITVDTLIGLAGDLGFDANSLSSCIEAAETNDLVAEDISSGIDAGVNGTPGNFLYNNETGDFIPLSGAVPFEQLVDAYNNIQ